MTEPQAIHIHKMIIHKVDHQNYDAPQMSDLESPVTEEVASFVHQHITSNREHRFARTAAFLPEQEGKASLSTLSNEMLDDADQFISQSQEIAKHLFQSMDRRVSPGDLVLCTFSEGTPSNPLWLALLKMDPEDGFIGVREEINGQVRFVLRRVADVLPRGELQKCAFIVPPKLREKLGHDLKVLDQQAVRYGGRRIAASFFVTDFLQCSIDLDPMDRTRTYVRASHQWVRRKHDWPSEDVERFKEAVTESLKGDHVDATNVATAVISASEEQDEYLEYLREEGLEDLTFEPDPQERKRQTEYLRFEGDHGLQLRIDAAAVGADKTLWYEWEDATNSWVVRIRTTRWERKPR